jgi:hypothetical protein
VVGSPTVAPPGRLRPRSAEHGTNNARTAARLAILLTAASGGKKVTPKPAGKNAAVETGEKNEDEGMVEAFVFCSIVAVQTEDTDHPHAPPGPPGKEGSSPNKNYCP